MRFQTGELFGGQIADVGAGHTPGIAEAKNLGQFIQGESDGQGRANETDPGDCVRRVAAVTIRGAWRTAEQTLAFVKAQGIRTDAHDPGQLSRTQWTRVLVHLTSLDPGAGSGVKGFFLRASALQRFWFDLDYS